MIHLDHSFRTAPRSFALFRPDRSGLCLELAVDHPEQATPVHVEVRDEVGLEPMLRLQHDASTRLRLKARGICTITLRCSGCDDLVLTLDARHVDARGRRILAQLVLHARLTMTPLSEAGTAKYELLCGTVAGTGLCWKLSKGAASKGTLGPSPMLLPRG